MKPETILSLPLHPQPYAVLGDPINHSLSPLMQQAAFDHLGIPASYYRIQVGEDDLFQTLVKMKQVGFGGWNCTVPNKIKMYDLCDRRAESAEQFRSVNTVVMEAGRMVGHSTDGQGWSRAIQETFGKSPSELRILLLGAGGAGRAIATQALLEECPELIIANRDQGRGLELLNHLERQFSVRTCPPTKAPIRLIPLSPDILTKELTQVDLVVNATSIGLEPNSPPILSAPQIPSDLMIYDTVYGAATDKLKTEVLAAGAKWGDGLAMLLHQGAAAFSLWTGQKAPLEIMRAALSPATSQR